MTLNKCASYETFTDIKRWTCLCPLPRRGADLQERCDLHWQQFCHSNANSKGQNPYLPEGLLKKAAPWDRGSSAQLWCQWGYQIRMWSPQGFPTLGRWLEEGHPRLKWCTGRHFFSEQLVPWDMTPPPTASFFLPNSMVTGPAPPAACSSLCL